MMEIYEPTGRLDFISQQAPLKIKVNIQVYLRHNEYIVDLQGPIPMNNNDYAQAILQVKGKSKYDGTYLFTKVFEVERANPSPKGSIYTVHTVIQRIGDDTALGDVKNTISQEEDVPLD
jgi:hypothetical protein